MRDNSPVAAMRKGKTLNMTNIRKSIRDNDGVSRKNTLSGIKSAEQENRLNKTPFPFSEQNIITGTNMQKKRKQIMQEIIFKRGNYFHLNYVQPAGIDKDFGDKTLPVPRFSRPES